MKCSSIFSEVVQFSKTTQIGTSESLRVVGTTGSPCPKFVAYILLLAVKVSDLFSNIPVRKKQLDAAVECEKVKQCLERLCLIHCEISFALYDSGMFRTVAHNDNLQ
jgi:hypothetical protein